MNIKGNLLEFCFEEDGIKETFAINVSKITHYYLTEDEDNYPVLQIYFTGRESYEEFYGINAGTIADEISALMSNGKVYELGLELENAYKFDSDNPKDLDQETESDK